MDEPFNPNRFSHPLDDEVIDALTQLLSPDLKFIELTIALPALSDGEDKGASVLRIDGNVVQAPKHILELAEKLRSLSQHERPGWDSSTYRMSRDANGNPEVEIESSACEGGGGGEEEFSDDECSGERFT